MKLLQFLSDDKWSPYLKVGLILLLFAFVSKIEYIVVAVKGAFNFLLPIIVGGVIAFALDILSKFYQQHFLSKIKPKISRIISIWLAIISVMAVVVLTGTVLVPQIVRSVMTLSASLENEINGSGVLAKRIAEWLPRGIEGEKVDEQLIRDTFDALTEKLPWGSEEKLSELLDKSINAGKIIADFVISFIVAIYLVFDKERLLKKWRLILKAIIPGVNYEKMGKLFDKCNQIFTEYIICDLFDALIIGGANFIFMTLLNMEYSVLISVVVGATNLAPTFGPIVGAVVGAAILAVDNPWNAVWFLIFTGLLQFADAFVIKPKLFGNTFGVSSLWILVSIILMGRAFGIDGVLLAIPLAAITDILYKDVLLYLMHPKIECDSD